VAGLGEQLPGARWIGLVELPTLGGQLVDRDRPLLERGGDERIRRALALRPSISVEDLVPVVGHRDGPANSHVFERVLIELHRGEAAGDFVGDVELRLTVSEEEATFSVRDTGIGIAAIDLPNIFDRFYRADRVRSRASERGGFGLGLSISQWIAQAHGGSLTVQSRLHRGSTFTVSLPIAAPALRATVPERQETSAEFASPETGPAAAALPD